ncbi:MAG: MerR family transcriptional regulator [Lachnospiraceae bacterium]|nr:MerR family transcriptional regulator [Lachnospiraceae bacterium]
MTIKEAERITGLSRSNIRFYEKEKLISPERNKNNGYREYSEEDIKIIQKIVYLRTLGISVEDIRRLSNKEAALYDVVKKQRQHLEEELSELENAKTMCEKMLSSGEKIDYENLEIERFVTDVKDYCSQNKNMISLDSVSFFYMWGGNFTWGVLTVICLLTAVCSFSHLPAEIPVQWSGGAVSSFVDKKFIFAFPFACMVIRFLLRPFIWRWIRINMIDSDSISDYITNYLCFIAFSVELFIILYVIGIAENVTVVLFLDTFVLIGLLVMAVYRITDTSVQGNATED